MPRASLALLAFLPLLAGGAVASDGSASPTAKVESLAESLMVAREAYERGAWASAFQQFQSLADGGSPPAARIALDMVRFGRQLFGTGFVATPEQLVRWRGLASTLD